MESFEAAEFHSVVSNIVSERLGKESSNRDVTLDLNNLSKLSNDLCALVMEATPKKYKFVVFCTMTEKSGAGTCIKGGRWGDLREEPYSPKERLLKFGFETEVLRISLTLHIVSPFASLTVSEETALEKIYEMKKNQEVEVK
eukprot:snap_masked-scaffold_9-processed-gene-1.29-mRNA-1 protein AED:1.00 eAED:1.00 QI:0/-1/0/0/-1/1/1/0/141